LRLRNLEWPELRVGHDVVADQALITPDAIATLDLYVRALYHRSRPSEVRRHLQASRGRAGDGEGGWPLQRRADPIIERTAEDERRASTARWSLVPRWAKSIKERPQWLNARSDKVLTSKLWKSLAARPEGRILIPADGWYEWMHAEEQRGGPKPAPFHHRIDDGGWFAFAGLRSLAHVEGVEGPLATVAIITPDAAGPAARLHDRMPVVLADADMMQAWLSPDLQLDDVPELLAPLAGDRITVQAASGLVNSARNDWPELLDPTVA
jgi:putative SOS response-associated peptidase YedK